MNRNSEADPAAGTVDLDNGVRSDAIVAALAAAGIEVRYASPYVPATKSRAERKSLEAESDALHRLEVAKRVVDLIRAEYGDHAEVEGGNVLLVAIHALVTDFGYRSALLTGRC